jgi:hypothetical protein
MSKFTPAENTMFDDAIGNMIFYDDAAMQDDNDMFGYGVMSCFFSFLPFAGRILFYFILSYFIHFIWIQY